MTPASLKWHGRCNGRLVEILQKCLQGRITTLILWAYLKQKATKIGKTINALDFPTEILQGICHFSDEKITAVETPTADSRKLFSMPCS
jgi:hypothetical protein